MCQVYGPAIQVRCSECGVGYYEDSVHTCKVFEPFESWNARLQERAKEKPTGNNLFDRILSATQAVALWSESKRRWCWSEENRHTVSA
jgi:hypothetical protein